MAILFCQKPGKHTGPSIHLLSMVHTIRPLTRFNRGGRLVSHTGVCSTVGLLPRDIPESRPL